MRHGLGVAACALWAVAAQAQDYPAPIQALIDKGITIKRTMPAPTGFQGYVGEFAGQLTPVYLLPDGRHTTVGVLYDEHGKDLTNAAFRAATASGRPDPVLWDRLEKSTWIAEGASKPERVVYVFTDTECPYCHKLWLATQPYLQQGKVQVRNVIVAVIAPSSLGRGAAVLSAKDPSATWSTHERAFGHSPIAPLTAVDPRMRAKIEANKALMTRFGAFGTPAIIYRDGNGQIRMVLGQPDTAALRRIFGS
ncbi:MAG: thiol:disulfide interchange protein DsbG [Rudaea sp.]